QAIGKFGKHALQMLQLLIELLAQASQFIRIAQLLGVSLFVVHTSVSTVGRFIVGVWTLATRLRTARPIIAFSDGGLLIRLGTFVVGRVAFHFLRIGAEHAVLL